MPVPELPLRLAVAEPVTPTAVPLLLNPVSRRGERMRVRAIRYVVAELGLAARIVHDPEHPEAGKSRVHPHTLRHTFGTQLLRDGVDIVIVADLMGHATLDTTRSYTRSSETDRARAIEDALISDE